MADEETYEESEDSSDAEDSYDEGEDSDSFVDTEGSDDSYTEVTHQSWGSRLQEQAGKSVAGFVLFLAAFPLLLWNEGRVVDITTALEEGKGAVIPVIADAVDASNNGKLIHFTGDATTDDVLTDLDFGIEASAIKLRRVTEMYQWEEEKEERKEKVSGGSERTVTTYKYKKVWSEDHINSGSFHRKASKGRKNPASIAYESNMSVAGRIVVGAFQLSTSLVKKIDAYEELRLPGSVIEQIGGRTVHRMGNGLYVGADPSASEIGDLKVRFEVVPTPIEVSVVSRQKGNRLEPYLSKTGTVELLQVGLASADLMFNKAEEELALETWILRLAGIVAMALGLSLLFKILETVIDRIPYVGIHIGTVLGTGTTLVAILIALPLALLTIAVAWFAARPILSIVLLLLAAGGFFGMRKLAK
jgi:hypothetical protein